MENDTVNPDNFVLPIPLLAHRIITGEGVRCSDVPVDKGTYHVLALATELSARIASVTIRPDKASAFSTVISSGDGPKAYPVDMDEGLKPQHTAERKQRVCKAIAKKLHAILVRSSRGRSGRFDGPYVNLTSSLGVAYIDLHASDLKKLGIALRSDEVDNLMLIGWIETDVAPMLTQLLKDDDHFKSHSITIYPEDFGSGTLHFQLERSENRR